VALCAGCKGLAGLAGGKRIAVALLGLLLVGCAVRPAPVVTVGQAPTVEPRQRVHVVVRGDTLYAIAWRYETTVDKLAQLNRLAPPYLIHVGSRLVLDPPVPADAAAGPAAAASGVVVLAVPEPPLETQPGPRPVVAGAPVLPPAPGAVPPAPDSLAPAPAAVPPAPGSPAPASSWSWQWPATGNVTRQHDSNGKFKGINIQSRPGTPIQAAAPGEVVYAGDGLRGYGQLIIVQHNEVYLSAYAYNRVMAVREGDKVTAGQRLGEVGGDAANPGRLYFEIRKQGEPIDPTRLLPSQ
jgi:lipoprotein NlpD